MSLDDMFNRNDGSMLDNLDSALINLHKKIGDFYQNKTHKSESSLRKILHGTSAASLLEYSIIDESYLMLWPALMNAVYSVTGYSGSKGNLETEVQSEFIGLTKKTLKVLNMVVYGLGISSTAAYLSLIGTGLAIDNPKILEQGINNLGYGMGVLSWMTAHYINKSNFEPPPPKPKRKPVLERVKDKIVQIKEKAEGLIPHGIPEPVPVKLFYQKENKS